jgi:rRNA maturation protein Nop10
MDQSLRETVTNCGVGIDVKAPEIRPEITDQYGKWMVMRKTARKIWEVNIVKGAKYANKLGEKITTKHHGHRDLKRGNREKPGEGIKV